METVISPTSYGNISNNRLSSYHDSKKYLHAVVKNKKVYEKREPVPMLNLNSLYYSMEEVKKPRENKL